jgi:hypothetical protein
VLKESCVRARLARRPARLARFVFAAAKLTRKLDGGVFLSGTLGTAEQQRRYATATEGIQEIVDAYVPEVYFREGSYSVFGSGYHG